MTYRTTRWGLRPLGAALSFLLVACGSNNGDPQPTMTPTATATATMTATRTAVPHPSPTVSRTATPPATTTPTQTSAVAGLVVVNHTVMSGPGDVLGVPPPEWSNDPSKAAFDRSLSDADWSVIGVDKQGVTGPDGRFSVSGLSPGKYTFQLTKTLDGNLASMSFPFTVGDDGKADVVAEVAWGLARSVSTYTRAGVQLQETDGPYGSWLITQDGHVRELGDPSRSFVDANGDGQLEPTPCFENVTTCKTDPECGMDRFCRCAEGCPTCPLVCNPGVCVPFGATPPYNCDPSGQCSGPGERCVCVPSCPACDDCARSVCVPGCTPVQITSITISGAPTQLVVGQQGNAVAYALFSDGSKLDVTYLATWHSSNDALLTVDAWGTVVARGIGNATLTATIGTLSSAAWNVNVVARPSLQHIYVQNASCIYPVGIPTDVGSKMPVAEPPASGILPPMPSCGQVVEIGKTIQFLAVGEFANGYYQDISHEVQWQLTPSAVGDVVDGLFTARQAGTATLTAALEGVVSDGTDLRVVSEPTVVSLSIYADNGIIAFVDGGPQRVDVAIPCTFAPQGGSCCCPGPGPLAATINPCDCGYSFTVLRGDLVKFRATAQYDTGEFRDVTAQVTWRSNNTTVATIDAQGVMTAVDAGDATIDAQLGDVSSNTVGAHVVNAATLQSLYIYQDGTDHVVATGDQRFFKATGNYDIGFGRDVTNTATWRSSNDTIGGFDTPGVFTGRAAGTVQVWAELDGKQSDPISIEVYETSDITYCDPAHVNRAVWSDNFNLVTLESDCGAYKQPGVAGLRYTVTELQPRGGIFDPCLDLYVYQGDTRVRTIREEGCGDPFLPAAAPGYDEAAVKYQLRAFWDLKGDDGQPVLPGTYTIYGRFYLYYDPVVSIDVNVLSPDGTLPTPLPTRTPTPRALCTPVFCPTGGVLVCPDGNCPGGCGYVCVPQGKLASLDVGSVTGVRGDAVQFDVSLRTAGQPVAGTQNDLFFDPAVSVVAQANGRPDCGVNPDIDKGSTAFAFIPAGCRPGVDCVGLRAIVISTDNNAPIPDNSVLYTCKVLIAANTSPGSYVLGVAGVVASDPMGNRLPIISNSGELTVVPRPGETIPPVSATPTAAAGQTVSATPTPASFPVCTPPVCKDSEVLHCPGPCSNGCKVVCATPTPTAFCTPVACPPDQVAYCPGACEGGCPSACAIPTPTPTPQGVCIRGSVDCAGDGSFEFQRSTCCKLSMLSASPLPFSWCPLEGWDFETGKCIVCAGDPCDGVPPTPTPAPEKAQRFPMNSIGT